MDIVGMPAARLRTGSRIVQGYHVAGKGGPAYGSTAWLWANSIADKVRVLDGVGGDRRFWLALDVQEQEELMMCQVQLPPPGDGQESDQLWVHEVQQLQEDLEELRRRRGPGPLKRVLIMGDMNMQPDVLGGQREPRRQRHKHWKKLCETWNLALHNPQLQPDIVQEVELQSRSRWVRACWGCTRHGGGVGRAIDLVVATPDVNLEMIIHNGLHCGGPEACDWPTCTDYARGDHFLIELRLGAWLGTQGQVEASARFPKAWRDGARWAQALPQAAPLFRAFASAVESAGEGVAGRGAGAEVLEQ